MNMTDVMQQTYLESVVDDLRIGLTGYAVTVGRNQRWYFLQLQEKSRLILQNVMRFSDNCKGDLYDLRASKVKYGEASNVTSALVAILHPIRQTVRLPDCHATRSQ